MVALQTRYRSRNKRMSTLQGKLRQKKEKGGQYYYRLAVAPGVRKEFSLKTADYNVACQKAEELDALWLAPTPEVAMAQINAIRGFSRSASKLLFADAWEKYQVHPDRATPHTVAEQQSYQRTYEEFVRFAIGGKTMKRGSRCAAVSCINEVTPKLCEEFSAYLKTTMLAASGS